MANRWAGAAAGLIAGQVVGRLLSIFLSSSAGERLLTRLDRRPLTPLEHRVLAQKWAGGIGKALSAAVITLVLARGGARRGTGSLEGAVRPSPMGKRNVDWVQLMQRVAEMMLAAGAMFKVIGEYLEDRRKTAAETQRAAAKRLF